MAKHGVVEFMATDFEIHFWTVDRLRTKIIEAKDDFLPALGFQPKTGRRHDG